MQSIESLVPEYPGYNDQTEIQIQLHPLAYAKNLPMCYENGKDTNPYWQ
jgi:hypothetical protein